MLKIRPVTLALALASVSLGMVLGCGGGTKVSGDRPDTLNWRLTIAPENPALVGGQSLQFTASTPWGGSAVWSVLPEAAGTITADGLFTAASAPQACTVYAAWSKDVRFAASVAVGILAPPAPAVSSPAYVQCSGAPQTVVGTSTANGAVVGELVSASRTVSEDGFIEVRNGFQPPIPGAFP